MNSGYVYDDSAGEGTCVYVIDSGLEATHPVCAPPSPPTQSTNRPIIAWFESKIGLPGFS